MLTVVAVKTTFANIASQIADVIWSTRGGRAMPYLIVVNDDTDPFNMTQVIHTLVTKCHPYRGIVRREHTTALGYFPWQNQHERKYRVGAKAYFDCTWPLDWDPSQVPRKASFTNIYPEKVQQAALAKWRKYGY
jgi:4-hydroxy-3-polyprenylbenzoate decarboxylase